MMGVQMKQSMDLKYKHRGKRKCRICGNVRGLIRKYGMYVCRKCFRENAVKFGFKKYS